MAIKRGDALVPGVNPSGVAVGRGSGVGVGANVGTAEAVGGAAVGGAAVGVGVADAQAATSPTATMVAKDTSFTVVNLQAGVAADGHESCTGLGRERRHGWDAMTALLAVVAGQQEVEHGQIGQWSTPGKKQGGADAVGAGHAVVPDVRAQGGFVAGRELHSGHAGLHS
jgi:hypothetical protein